jgi:uracil-DNA glycosylase
MNFHQELQELQEAVIRCRKCPRLVLYREEVAHHRPKRFRDWRYWARPLPSFGDPDGRVLIVGLAPAANGGNRTGRMFTGDRSGDWLFKALFQFGFANRPESTDREDGLVLTDCYITATIRCAPPDNKPLPSEVESCRPYLLRELDLLRNVSILIPLGQIAFSHLLRSLRMKGLSVPPLPFGHGRTCDVNGRALITSYHPSQQNTQTGKLTEEMFHAVFQTARRLLDARNHGKDVSNPSGRTADP